MPKTTTAHTTSPNFLHTGAPALLSQIRTVIEAHNYALGLVTEEILTFYGSAKDGLERLQFEPTTRTWINKQVLVPLHIQQIGARLVLRGTGTASVTVSIGNLSLVFSGLGAGTYTQIGPRPPTGSQVMVSCAVFGSGDTSMWLESLWVRTQTIASGNIPDPPTG